MPDEPVFVAEPPPEPPAAPEPEPVAPPDPNLYDDRGVPWRNVASENQRKLQESAERERQYQARLGQQYQQPQAPQPAPQDELEGYVSQFEPGVQKALRGMAQVLESRAEQKARQVAKSEAYEFTTQLTQNQELQNQELLSEARNQRAILDSNPMWTGVNEILRNDRAIAEAKLILAQRKPAAQVAAPRTPGQPPPGLPPTRPGATAASVNDKETYIKKFMSDPNTILIARKMFGSKFDPNSTDGQRKLRESAEIEFEEGGINMWGGNVKSAVDAIMRESQRSRS